MKITNSIIEKAQKFICKSITEESLKNVDIYVSNEVSVTTPKY